MCCLFCRLWLLPFAPALASKVSSASNRVDFCRGECGAGQVEAEDEALGYEIRLIPVGDPRRNGAVIVVVSEVGPLEIVIDAEIGEAQKTPELHGKRQGPAENVATQSDGRHNDELAQSDFVGAFEVAHEGMLVFLCDAILVKPGRQSESRRGVHESGQHLCDMDVLDTGSIQLSGVASSGRMIGQERSSDDVLLVALSDDIFDARYGWTTPEGFYYRWRFAKGHTVAVQGLGDVVDDMLEF